MPFVALGGAFAFDTSNSGGGLALLDFGSGGGLAGLSVDGILVLDGGGGINARSLSA